MEGFSERHVENDVTAVSRDAVYGDQLKIPTSLRGRGGGGGGVVVETRQVALSQGLMLAIIKVPEE